MMMMMSSGRAAVSGLLPVGFINSALYLRTNAVFFASYMVTLIPLAPMGWDGINSPVYVSHYPD